MNPRFYTTYNRSILRWKNESQFKIKNRDKETRRHRFKTDWQEKKSINDFSTNSSFYKKVIFLQTGINKKRFVFIYPELAVNLKRRSDEIIKRRKKGEVFPTSIFQQRFPTIIPLSSSPSFYTIIRQLIIRTIKNNWPIPESMAETRSNSNFKSFHNHREIL